MTEGRDLRWGSYASKLLRRSDFESTLNQLVFGSRYETPCAQMSQLLLRRLKAQIERPLWLRLSNHLYTQTAFSLVRDCVAKESPFLFSSPEENRHDRNQ